MKSELCLVTEGFDHIHIPIKAEHCLRNNLNEELLVVEVQLGEILEESDIIRISDIYGRKDD